MPDALRAVIIAAKMVFYAIKYCLKAVLRIFTFWKSFSKSKVSEE